MKIIKWLIYSIIGIFVLALLLVGGIILFFDPNSYKAEIQSLVKEKANVELNIAGKISWSFYPRLGLSLEDTSVASVTMPKYPFAKVKTMELSVMLLPLLKRQVQMNDVKIDGLILDLQKNKSGQTNWAQIGNTTKNSGATNADTPTTSPIETAPSNTKKIDLNIQNITLKNTQIYYQNAEAKQNYVLSNIQLSTNTIRIGEPVAIKLSADFNNKQPEITMKIASQGDVVYDLAGQQYALKNFKLTNSLSGKTFKGKTLTLIALGDLKADLIANTAEWNALQLTLDRLKVGGNIKAANIQSAAPTIEGDLNIETFNLRDLLTNMEIALPNMANKSALTSVSLGAKLTATNKAATLNALKIKLDTTNLTGTAQVTDFATNALKVVLKGDTLNVDHYLPPKAKPVKATANTAQAGSAQTNPPKNSPTPLWSNATLFDPKSLQGFIVEADLNIANLTVSNLNLKNFTSKISANKGLIIINNMGGNLFNGAISLKGSLNAQSATPKIALQPTLKNISLEQLLASQALNLPIKGIINLTGNVQSSGNSLSQLVKNLNGQSSFIVTEGTLINMNYDEELCKGIALLNQKSLTTQFNNKDTKFTQLSGGFNIVNGVASNQDLAIAIPGVAAKGKGSLDINSLMLNYNIGLIVIGDQRSNSDPACQVNKNFANIEFPLLCKGSVISGKNICTIDQQGLANVALKMAEGKVKEKAKEKINEAINKELGKGKLGKELDKAPEVKRLLEGLLKK